MTIEQHTAAAAAVAAAASRLARSAAPPHGQPGATKRYKHIFSNMFIYAENDTESHRNILNRNVQDKTHQKHQYIFPTIHSL